MLFMHSITKIFDRYQTFENDLKQKSFWLFTPVYITKIVTLYAITLIISINVAMFMFHTSNFIENIYRFNTIIDNVIHYPIILIMYISPGLTYYILFSRNKINIHPYITTFLFYYLADSQDEGFYLGLYFGMIASIIIIVIHYLIKLFKHLKYKHAN